MLHRFAAACVVASVIIAAGALMSLLLGLTPELARTLTTAWCVVPLVWGVWAMLAPAQWVPSRLPLWGAILGLPAGIVAGPVLDLPSRMGGPDGARWLVLVLAPLLYYALWLLVGSAYRSLRITDDSA